MPSGLMAMDLAWALILASAYRSVSSLEVKATASGSSLSLGLQYSMLPAQLRLVKQGESWLCG